jgi:hypothetical protein
MRAPIRLPAGWWRWPEVTSWPSKWRLGLWRLERGADPSPLAPKPLMLRWRWISCGWPLRGSGETSKLGRKTNRIPRLGDRKAPGWGRLASLGRKDGARRYRPLPGGWGRNKPPFSGASVRSEARSMQTRGAHRTRSISPSTSATSFPIQSMTSKTPKGSVNPAPC